MYGDDDVLAEHAVDGGSETSLPGDRGYVSVTGGQVQRGDEANASTHTYGR
jgi:hypothetical protein